MVVLAVSLTSRSLVQPGSDESIFSKTLVVVVLLVKHVDSLDLGERHAWTLVDERVVVGVHMDDALSILFKVKHF